MHKKNYFKNFYSFIFILWYSSEIIFNTTLKTVLGINITILNDIVSWVVFALLMLQIMFMQSYKKKELVIILSITSPIIIATILSGNRTLLSVWMFIVASKNASFDKIIQIAYKILLIMVPLVILLRLVGVIEDYMMMRGSIQRFSLGFSHPNQLGLRVFQLTLCHCYVNRDRLKIWNYCYIILAIIFTVVFSNSQTAYISLIVFLILLLVYRFIENKGQMIIEIFAKGLAVGALLLNVLSIVLSYIDVNKNIILSRIDRWMSARFSWCHRVWEIYGVSFWGQRVYVTEEESKLIGFTNRLWLDNAYATILLRYGILVFLIVSIAYLSLIKGMVVRKEYVLVIILFLYALYGLMENGLFMLSHNIFLLAFADLLYHKVNINRELDEKLQRIESTKVNG